MQGMTNLLHDLKNENSKAAESKTGRSRRKSRWKLKFHHQALPPEYLDHYEASLSKQSLANAANAMKSKSAASCVSPPSTGSSSAPVKSPNPGSGGKKPAEPCTVRYTDLPYMGEMTLDNARPRRGRKPKKADICHLIYKNYGTTVLDEEPLNLCLRDLNHSNNNCNNSNNSSPSATITSSPPLKYPMKPCDLYNFNLASVAAGKNLNFPANFGNHIDVTSSTTGMNGGGAHSSNNEVSMCKFKFTGGPVPILQEKKMLSVDFTGNLKYSLGNTEQPTFKCNPSSNRLANNSSSPATSSVNNSVNINKRKSRKSLAREKLEKTFKEKGFLIQTQQLESDQGATYCKFRQLRKFTRYLFRSWKHHLPGEVMDTSTSGTVNTDPP